MSSPLEGKKVFLHDNLRELGFDMYAPNLNMINVLDEHEAVELPIEQRFIRSTADVAFIHALPYIFQDSGDILQSRMLRSKAVVLTHYDEQLEFVRFNKALKDYGFLYIWLDQMNDNFTLGNLFLKALKNV